MRDAIPANDYLRSLWAKLDKGLAAFDFGPVFDLFPIQTNAVAVSRYFIKTFLQGLPHQKPEDKGMRLVTYSRGCPRKAKAGWRPKSIWFEQRLEPLLRAFGLNSKADLKAMLGHRWGFSILQLIHILDFDCGPSWHESSIEKLAPMIMKLFTTWPSLSEHLGPLIPGLEARIARTTIPFGPPPLPTPFCARHDQLEQSKRRSAAGRLSFQAKLLHPMCRGSTSRQSVSGAVLVE